MTDKLNKLYSILGEPRSCGEAATFVEEATAGAGNEENAIALLKELANDALNPYVRSEARRQLMEG